MSNLPMIKTAAGWVVDITELNVGDTIVVQTEQWPHNYVGLDFKQLTQYNGVFHKNIYAAAVQYKPNQGITFAQQRKPNISVFRADAVVNDLELRDD